MKPAVKLKKTSGKISKAQTKTSPQGNQYKVIVVPLMLLPQYLERNNLEPREWFYYLPEGGYVLGVRKIEETPSPA